MVTVKGNIAEFSFFRPRAKQGFIVGDFNGWREGANPMIKTPEGNWIASIKLSEGDFNFRYRIDGEWFIDYAACGITCGEWGLDSVVRVVGPKLVRKAGPSAPAKAAAVKLTPAKAASSKDSNTRPVRRRVGARA